MEIKEELSRNIYRFRKIAGLNQQEVAEKIGLSRTAFIAIEKGEALPRKENINKIANALNVKIVDLFKTMPELKSIRFRMSKINAQRKKIREQEIVKFAYWLKNYVFLEKILNNKLSYKLKNLKNKDPQQLATDARQLLGIDKNEPICDISVVMSTAGIKLHFFEKYIPGLFGLSVNEVDGGPAISVNVDKGLSIERQIFTVAHELGHLLMHKDSYKNDILEDDEKEEKEANLFASYFLMPNNEFKKVAGEKKGLHWIDAVLNIKRYFKVSYKTVLMRLVDNKMADNNIYRDFAVQYKKMYDADLKNHAEPAALREPDGPANIELQEERLFLLAREALEKDLISVGKTAEILNKSVSEMRNIINSWGEINWT